MFRRGIGRRVRLVNRLFTASLCFGSALMVGACDRGATGPGDSITINLGVHFTSEIEGLTSMEATLTDLSTGASVQSSFSQVSGSNGLAWTSSAVSVQPGTDSVVVEGLDASGTVILIGGGRISVAAGSNTTFYFVLVCISSECRSTTDGTVTLVAIVPQAEEEPNNSLGTAQGLTTTLWFNNQLQYAAANGTIGSGDADYYAVSFYNVTAGDSIFVSVFSSRFGLGLDPVAALYDPSGTEVAYDDDAFGLDPYIAYVAPSSASSATYTIGVGGYETSTGPYTVLAFLCHPGGGVFCH